VKREVGEGLAVSKDKVVIDQGDEFGWASSAVTPRCTGSEESARSSRELLQARNGPREKKAVKRSEV
jgi:hypothetical protein